MPRIRRSGAGLVRRALICAALLAARIARAEEIAAHEDLDFDRPEAWGMKLAAAVTAFTSLGATRALPSGAVELGFEVSSVPSLSEEQQRLGFVGTKSEDIERSPAFGRLRAAFGLPRSFALEVGVVPPVELDGLEPTYLAVALARPLLEHAGFRLAARLGAGLGSLEGDITCSQDEVDAGDDPEANPFGCEEPSNDELETTLLSLELVAVRAAAREGGFEPYLSVAAHHLDGNFQVDARYRGIVDRSKLETDGFLWSVAAGGSGAVGGHWRLSGELFWSPIEVRRPGEDVAIDPAWSGRIALTRKLR